MSVTLTGTDLTVFGGAVYASYMISDLFGTSGMQFYGVKPTEAVNVPVVQAGDARFFDDGADHTTVENSSLKGVNVPLFIPIKSSNVVKRSQVDVRPDLSLLRNLGKQHGRNVGRIKTITCQCILATAASDSSNKIIQTSAASPQQTKDVIKDVAAAMDIAGIPADGRMAMLKSDVWYELSDQEGVMRKDFGGQANVQNLAGNLDVIRYLNFDIKNCGAGFGTDWTATAQAGIVFPANVAANLTGVMGLFWHEDAWALRHQTSLETSAGWVEHLQAWLVLARLHMGAKAIMTDTLMLFKEGIYSWTTA